MKAATVLVFAVALSLAFVASSAPAEDWDRANNPFMRMAEVNDANKMLLETSSSSRIKTMVARMRRGDESSEESSEATEESSEATEESSEATQEASEATEATEASQQEASEATESTEESSEATESTSEESSQAAVTQELAKEQELAAQELADAAAKQQQSAAEEETKSADAALQAKNTAEEQEKQERRVKEKADVEFQRIKSQAEALQKRTVEDAKEKAKLIIAEAEAKQAAKKVKVVVQKTCCENCANDPCQGQEENSEESAQSWVDAEIAVPEDQGAALAEQLADLGLTKKLTVDSRVFKTAQAVLDASTARHAAFEEKHKKDCKGPICPFADGKTVQANTQ